MTKIKNLKQITFFSLLFFLFSTQSLFATIDNPIRADTIKGLILSLVCFLWSFAVPITIFIILVGALYIMTGLGDNEIIAKGKNKAIYAILGFFIIVIAVAFTGVCKAPGAIPTPFIVTPTLSAITVNPNPVDIVIGGQQTFLATPHPTGSSLGPIIWTTSNPAIGTISSGGQFTAGTTTGVVTVTATSLLNPAVSGIAIANVISPAVGTIAVVPSSPSLLIGGTQTFTAHSATGALPGAIWTVDNSSIGTIDAYGKFTANNFGGTLVWAIYSNYSPGSATVSVGRALTGWAWSDVIGWISLSCHNMGTCSIADYQVAIDGLTGDLSGWAWSPAIGWISLSCDNMGTCATVDYRVTADLTYYILSGWAWSDVIGWISFDALGPYPDYPYHPATVDVANGTIRGWAYSTSIGWIHFGH